MNDKTVSSSKPRCDLAAIRQRDAATLDRPIAGDQSLAWKRVLLDRRDLLAEIDRLSTDLEHANRRIIHLDGALRSNANETEEDRLFEKASGEPT